MKTTAKLSFTMFVERFIWGAWLVPLWLRLSKSDSSAGEVGWSYARTAIVAILSSILVGSITGHFFSAQKALVVSMFVGTVLMYFVVQQTIFAGFFPSLLVYSLTYMPTTVLTNSIAFANVSGVERDFPRIRVMGIIGWVASGLACGFLPQMLGHADILPTNTPPLITTGSPALLGVFVFFLPDTSSKSTGKMDIRTMLGLDTLILLRDKSFLVFFFCSSLLAMPLALYYIFANGYLTKVGIENVTGWMTLGQFSEIFSTLVLPFFIKRFGIKKVLLLGLAIVAIRYDFFIYGSADEYFTYALLFLGILLYGISYDFYYITVYIYVDKKAPVHIRTAAQGLITLCCQGLGSLFGYRLGGAMMEKMFAYRESINGPTLNWAGMWTLGAVMIVIIVVLSVIFFRESDNEITAIKVDDHDIALTQGEVK